MFVRFPWGLLVFPILRVIIGAPHLLSGSLSGVSYLSLSELIPHPDVVYFFSKSPRHFSLLQAVTNCCRLSRRKALAMMP